MSGQLWANVTIDWLSSERVTYALDVEPKTQRVVHAGTPTWLSGDAIPHVEYALAPWIDLLSEVDVGFQNQSDDVDTVTVTPRIGIQVHILSRILRPHAPSGAAREKVPRRRLVFGSLLRLENQNTFHSTGAASTSSWRFRDRFEMSYPLNRRKATIDGAVYVTGDSELFIPVDRSTSGGIVSESRVRAGIGFRQSFAWRFEALYVSTAQRNAAGALAPKNYAIDVRVRHEL
jgi:hypothetical protein